MPEAGETSDASNGPSLDATAALKELISSRPRGSSQNGGATNGAGEFVGGGGCVSAGMGVNVGGTIKVGCVPAGVSLVSGVGGGATSTGVEQFVRVKMIRMGKYILSFILHPFNKKLAEDSAS